jgi:hypothetical protein
MSWRERLPRSLRARLALGVLAGSVLVLSISFVVLSSTPGSTKT